MAVLPDGRIVSASYDKTVRIWNFDTGECVRVLEAHSKVSVICVVPMMFLNTYTWYDVC